MNKWSCSTKTMNDSSHFASVHALHWGVVVTYRETSEGRKICAASGENISNCPEAWTPVWETAFELFGGKQSVAQPVLVIKIKQPLSSVSSGIPTLSNCWSMDCTICLLRSLMCETRSSVDVMCETQTASSPPLHQRTGSSFRKFLAPEQLCQSCIFFWTVLTSLELFTCWRSGSTINVFF